MFQRKTQQVTVTIPPVEVNECTAPTGKRLMGVLIPAAAAAAAATKTKLSEQKEHGMAVAAPALAAAGAAVAPKLGEARDRVEEEVLPRVADAREQVMEAKEQFVAETLPKLMEAVSGAIAAGAVAKADAVAKVRDSQAVHRAGDAALVLKGDAVVKREPEKGGFWSGLLTVFGLLTVAGGLAWFFNKRAAEQDDPWARPLADPYVPPTTGRDSSVADTGAVGTVQGAAGSAGLVADGAFSTASAQVGRFGDIADGEAAGEFPPEGAGAAEVRVIDPAEFNHEPEQDASGDSAQDAQDKKDF